MSCHCLWKFGWLALPLRIPSSSRHKCKYLSKNLWLSKIPLVWYVSTPQCLNRIGQDNFPKWQPRKPSVSGTRERWARVAGFEEANKIWRLNHEHCLLQLSVTNRKFSTCHERPNKIARDETKMELPFCWKTPVGQVEMPFVSPCLSYLQVPTLLWIYFYLSLPSLSHYFPKSYIKYVLAVMFLDLQVASRTSFGISEMFKISLWTLFIHT